MNAQELLSQLSNEEKCALGSGADTWRSEAIPHLGLPSILFQDGPHGLRKQASSTDALGMNESIAASCFPTASISACSFDPELLSEMGKALSQEALEQEIDVLLGPGVNIKRSPLCGRNFEYFSEDPLLSGELASGYVSALQAEGIGASLKHFAANSQETARLISNSQVDERALREIYLKAFEIVVRKAQPWTIMPSYNRLNGSYACQNEQLLSRIARDEWGFEGLFISDWGAVDNRVEAVEAGLDLEMPSSGGYRDNELLQALKQGKVKPESVDRAVVKLLTLVEKCQKAKVKPGKEIYHENHELARKILTESAVLLANNDMLLPLAADADVLLVGELAEKPHYQGSGSSRVNPTRLVSLKEAIQKQGLNWEFQTGYRTDEEKPNQSLINYACKAAIGKKAVIVVAGLTEADEAEGFDREHLKLQPAQNELIHRLAVVNPNLIVVLQGGGVMELPWFDQVKSILFVGLGGQAIGEGTLDLLLGKQNPSGKMAESWPFSLEDSPAFHSYGQRYNTPYLESIFVGYRYYHTAGQPVRFPFGYGLSYTEFIFSDLHSSETELQSGESLKLKIKVDNIGKLAGKEVVQVYVSAPESKLFRPVKELKAFKKICLEAGESKEVEFELKFEDFAIWNVDSHSWEVENGNYEILLGNSSVNLPLKAEVYLHGFDAISTKILNPQYFNLALSKNNFNLEEFEKLPGSVSVQERKPKPGNFDLNSSLSDAQPFWIGRQIIKFAKKFGDTMVEGSDDDSSANTKRMVDASLMDSPLRSFVMGGVPMGVSVGIVDLLNLKIIKGLSVIFKTLILKK